MNKGRGMTRRTVLLPALVATAMLVACSVAMLVPSREAEATYPGENGRIAFAVRPSVFEDSEIYTSEPDGTDRKRLTDNLTDEYTPDFSPDGTEIAFSGGRESLFVMNSDGTNVRNLSGSNVGDRQPAFSPDGTEIAFTHRKDIWVMDADGTDRKNLTDTGPIGGRDVSEGEPTWSPDGTRIAFVKTTYGPPREVDLYTMNSDGTGLKQLTDSVAAGEGSPDWGPGGVRLTYHRYSGGVLRVFTIKADGTGKGKKLVATNGYQPVFSPDGQKIAFVRKGDVWTVGRDGTGELNATDTAQWPSEVAPDWGPKPATTP
jgi:Tol biopolymer transport system component